MRWVAATKTQPGSIWGPWPLAARRPGTRVPVIAAVSLLYAAVLALTVSVLLRPPQLSLGLSSPSRGEVRVAWIFPGGYLWNRGVRPGQQILGLDNAPARDQTGLWQGNSVIVRTTAGAIRISSAGLRAGHNTWPLAVLSPWFLVLGTLVLLRAVPRPVATAAYTLFTSSAIALALAGAADDNNLLAASAELVVIPLFAFAFARFFLLFPVPRRPRRWTGLLATLALATGALGLAELVWPSLYAPVSLLQLAGLLACLLTGLALLVRGFLDTHDPALRHGLAVLAGSTIISVLPFGALSIAPPMFGYQPLMPAEEAILALAVLPAGFSYAVLRHNILQAPLIQRWLVQMVLWGVLAAVFGVALDALFRLSGIEVIAFRPALLVAPALLLVTALSVRWLHDRLLLTLDRAIFKDAYDYRASLHQLSQDLSLAGDLDAVSQSLLNRLCRLMNLEFAMLLIQEEYGVQLRAACGRHVPLPSLAPFVAAAEPNGKPSLVSLTGNDRPSLLVPLRLQDTSVGYLWLGAKSSGEPFRAADYDLLSTLGGHLATLIRNAQLMDDLRQQAQTLDVLNDRLEDAQEAERSHLAAELHDEPLQTALQLHRVLVSSADRDDTDDPGSAANLSRMIAGQLRTICAAMRPPVLDDLGLVAALDLLVFDITQRDELTITLDADGESLSDCLPPELELTLYRAAQEALTNCRRHASATAVQISLERLGDTVQLRVIDNGAGFAVPRRLDSLANDGHLGLAGLYHRVARTGGRVVVRSQPGGGTTVEVCVPCREAVS